MSLAIALGVGGGLLALATLVRLAVLLGRRPPYRAIISLPMRSKARFFRGVWADRRVPLMARLLVPLTILYLLLPFDIIPDFLPIVGQLDDLLIVVLALVLFVRLCPRPALEEHLARGLEGD